MRSDASSSTTVLGYNLYQNISSPATNAGVGLGSSPITLQTTDPLFVNAAGGNFYLAAGTQAFQTALTSLPDRPGMETVETALGLPQSPMLARRPR